MRFFDVRLPQDLEKFRRADEYIADETTQIGVSANAGSLDEYLDEIVARAPLFEKFPQLSLSLIADVRDSEFLRHFPSLGGLKILSGTQTSYEGLRYVPRLEWLDLAGEGSLRPLKYVPNVRRLGLGGKLSHLESVGLLAELEELMCPALQPPSVLDFAKLTHLSRLHMLQFNGASAASLDWLADFQICAGLVPSVTTGHSSENFARCDGCGLDKAASLLDSRILEHATGSTGFGS